MKVRLSVLSLTTCAAWTLFAATGYAQTGFDPLFRLANVEGVCLVRAPDASVFVPAVNRRAYPYGTTVQIGPESEAVVLFSRDNSIHLIGPAEATVAIQTNNADWRVLYLAHGEARVFVKESLPEKAIIVETPVATCDAFTGGQTTIKVSREADGMIVMRIDTKAGGTRVTGPQFSVPSLKSARGFQVSTTPDRSLTRLTNMGGEYPILLDNATDVPVTFDSAFKSSVKIWRGHAPVGGRQIVSIFVVDPDGKGKECYAFAVGRPSITSSGMPVFAADNEILPPPVATPDVKSVF